MGFEYRARQLACEQVDLATIAAHVGTPVYVYNLRVVEARYHAYAWAFPGALLAHAYKANANLALCRFLARLGAGADVVSSSEFVARQPAGRIVVLRVQRPPPPGRGCRSDLPVGAGFPRPYIMSKYLTKMVN